MRRRAGVVGGEREQALVDLRPSARPCSSWSIDEAQVLDAGVDVGLEPASTPLMLIGSSARGGRHDLHDADRAGRAPRVLVEPRLLVALRGQQQPVASRTAVAVLAEELARSARNFAHLRLGRRRSSRTACSPRYRLQERRCRTSEPLPVRRRRRRRPRSRSSRAALADRPARSAPPVAHGDARGAARRFGEDLRPELGHDSRRRRSIGDEAGVHHLEQVLVLELLVRPRRSRPAACPRCLKPRVERDERSS